MEPSVLTSRPPRLHKAWLKYLYNVFSFFYKIVCDQRRKTISLFLFWKWNFSTNAPSLHKHLVFSIFFFFCFFVCFFFVCLFFLLTSYIILYRDDTQRVLVLYWNARLSSLRSFLFLYCNHCPKANHVVHFRELSLDIAQRAPIYT